MDAALTNVIVNGIETSGELIVPSKKTERGRLLISVSDTGVEVPVMDVERLFEAFFTIKPQSTGLGLSISRRMVESQRGSFADERQHRTEDDLSVQLAS